MGVIKEHNQRMEVLVGTEYASGTLNRYRVLESHTRAFLKEKFGASDLDIKKVDFSFVSDYEFYLRSVRKMSNNSVVRHMKMLRKIINICLTKTFYKMIEKSFGLLFFLKQSKHQKSESRYVFIRITVNGKSREISTKKQWEISRWSSNSGRALGNR